MACEVDKPKVVGATARAERAHVSVELAGIRQDLWGAQLRFVPGGCQGLAEVLDILNTRRDPQTIEPSSTTRRDGAVRDLLYD